MGRDFGRAGGILLVLLGLRTTYNIASVNGDRNGASSDGGLGNELVISTSRISVFELPLVQHRQVQLDHSCSELSLVA